MASTSDLSAAGGGEERSVAAAAAASSFSEPQPAPSSSSKRRWSPCTWRYAIEEGQPDLGSRPRSSSSSAPHASSSLRAAISPDLSVLPSASKSRPLHGQDHAIYARDGEQAARRAVYAGRAWPASDLSEPRARHTQSRVHDMPARKKAPLPQRLHPPNQQQEPAQRPAEKDEEDDDDEDERDDDGEAGHDAELMHHFVDSKKRKKRDISPSELYFCEICRGKAVEAPKQSSSPDISPHPLQGS